MWEKLSNSGDVLKLIILNYIWRYISGWSNYSGIVTSYKISENVMDNRGSKPNKGKILFVKEQRVDDSWRNMNNVMFKVYSNGFRKKLSTQNPFLANILVNYISRVGANVCLVKYNLLFNRKFSSLNNLDGWVSGFVDAEGCFRVSVLKNKNYKGNPWLSYLYENEKL